MDIDIWKKFAAALRAATLFSFFFNSALRGTAWPLHFEFASYAYGMWMAASSEKFGSCSILLYKADNYYKVLCEWVLQVSRNIKEALSGFE